MEYMYGVLLLHKLGEAVSEENLKKVISATGKPIDEAKVKVLVESLRGVDIDKELEQATVTSVTTATGGEEKVEEKKEEKKEEKPSEAAEGLSSLFG